jgi:hypothetical protein
MFGPLGTFGGPHHLPPKSTGAVGAPRKRAAPKTRSRPVLSLPRQTPLKDLPQQPIGD